MSAWTEKPSTWVYHATLLARSVTVRLTWWKPFIGGTGPAPVAGSISPSSSIAGEGYPRVSLVTAGSLATKPGRGLSVAVA
jgi:hypothetical protein